jgi:hypothetical protein
MNRYVYVILFLLSFCHNSAAQSIPIDTLLRYYDTLRREYYEVSSLNKCVKFSYMGLLLSYVSQENQYHTQFVDMKFINKKKLLQFNYFCVMNNLFTLQNCYKKDTIKPLYVIVINHNYYFKVINYTIGHEKCLDDFIYYINSLIPRKYKKKYAIPM